MSNPAVNSTVDSETTVTAYGYRLKPNPFESFRDPKTGKWRVVFKPQRSTPLDPSLNSSLSTSLNNPKNSGACTPGKSRSTRQLWLAQTLPVHSLQKQQHSSFG